jgi:hypothetical protein
MPGWNDGNEIPVASDGQVYFADVGTTLPAKGSDPDAALPSPWVGGGFVSEDGFGHSLERAIAAIRAFQSLTDVRRVKESEQINLTFALMQWNETNLVFALGGGSVTNHSGSLFTYDYPAPSDGLVEKSVVLNIADGSKSYRFVFQRGTVSEPVETNFRRNEAALLPVTFGVLAPEGGGSPGYIIGDDANFAAGS